MTSRQERARGRRERGQSMVEFSVVCFFGLIGVIAIWPYLRIDRTDDVESLPEAIQANYARYAYVVSLSELPDEYGSTLSNTGAIDLQPVEDLTTVLANGIPDDFPEGVDLEDGLGNADDLIREGLEPLLSGGLLGF